MRSVATPRPLEAARVLALRPARMLESQRRVARARDALHPQRELARVGRVEQRALVRDDALRVPLHERLVEALHAVLHGAFLDQVGNVERLVHVADLVAHRGGVDQHFARGDAARLVGARHEAQRDDRLQRAREREAHLGLLVRRVERQHAVDRLRRVRRVQRREHEVTRVRRLERGVERLEVANLADEDDVRILPQHAAQRLREAGGVGADLALVDVAVDVAMEELDRILDRDDVRVAVLVDVLDHRRERRRLARAGDAR